MHIYQCMSKAEKSDTVYGENISYFFPSDDKIYIFSLQQAEAISTILGLISSRKDLECTVRVRHYAVDART